MKLRLSCAVLVFSMSTSLLAQAPAQPVAAEAAPAEAAAAAVPVVEAAAVDPAAAVADALAALAQTKPGDAAAGATKAAVCAACHGMDGNSADPLYPKIAGQHEAYLAKQLTLFKTGARANAIMLGFAATLSAQDMRDIGAHFDRQKISPGLADESVISDKLSPNNGLRVVDVGQKLYRGGDAARGIPACSACHGPSGTGVPGPSFPAIGGQHNGYLATMLRTFKATAPGSPMLDDDRYASMAQIAARLTEEEIVALSSYLEGLHARSDVATAATQP